VRSAAPITAFAIVFFTAVRLVLAAALPLAPDEAYYWVWSRALAPGYFDHPPMVALWIRAGTWLLGDIPLGIRLLGPLSAALGSVLLWDAAEHLLPHRNAGAVAVLLINTTVLVGVGAVLATPDAPLLLFWTAVLWAMARITAGGSGAWWLSAGIFTGLAFASKYTAVLLVLGIGIWVAMAAPQWLRRAGPYAAAGVTLAIAAPVLWWNATHSWVSFVRQGGRAGVWLPQRAPQYLAELVAGQLALATPLIFLFLIGGMAVAARIAWRRREPVSTLLATMSVVPALVFVQHALGDRVQANWPAIAYPGAAMAAAALRGRFWQRLLLPAIGLGLLMTTAVYVQAVFAPLTLPPKFDPIALQTGGWQGFATVVEQARRRNGGGFVAADNYGVAAELARSLPASVPVIAVGPRWSSFELPAPAVDNASGILVEPRGGGKPIWQSAEPVGTAVREQQGTVIERFDLYRAVPDHSASAAILPRPASR
jgi:4-amino-4-deoxy-L-arabinose transferase-like glycosyltransferase